MKVILFGATGMVGMGVLRACLLDSGVELILCVGRSRSGEQHPSCANSSIPIRSISRRSNLN
jgi:hypothetical protein